MPEDVTINVSKDARVPEPPSGHKWKQVQHDSKVTWLASWTENIQGQIKYIMLNPTSRLKVGGERAEQCKMICAYLIHVKDCCLPLVIEIYHAYFLLPLQHGSCWSILFITCSNQLLGGQFTSAIYQGAMCSQSTISSPHKHSSFHWKQIP